MYSETKFDAKLAVYRLLSTGIEPMSADDLYEYLIEDNWQPALRTYIDQGSDLNETDTNGQALLHWAAMLHNSGQVSYIISQGGIEIDKQDDRGDTPLHLATQSTMEALYSGNKPDFSTVAVLLKAGANHNIKNKYGETAVELTKGYEKDMYYKQQFEQYIK